VGVLTDVFVASDDEVLSPEWDGSSPDGRFPTLQAKGIGSDTLALLSALLAGESPLAIGQHPARFVYEMDRLFPMVRVFGDAPGDPESADGPWVFRIAEEFLRALLKLTSEEVESYTAQWVSLMWEGHHRSTQMLDDYAQYLGDLQRLALSRRSEEQRLFLWVCL
jgi:hypothetical protein